ALMAVLCMIIFVFQFGAGDVFTRGLQWFGAYRGRGDVIVTLYGDAIHEGDLEKIRRQRLLASEFMTNHNQQVVPYQLILSVRDLIDQSKKAQPETPTVPVAVREVANSFLSRNDPQHPEFNFRIRSLTIDERQRQVQNNLHELR